MLRVALKSVLARKRRLFTTGFAIVLSVAFISGTLVITALIDSTLGGLIGSSYQGIDAIVRSSSAQESEFGQPVREPIAASGLELVRAAKGVKSAEGFVQGYPTLIDKDGERIQDTIGPPTLAYNWVDDELLQGGRLAPGGRAPETPDEVVIDVRTAEDFDFAVGDKIQAQFPVGLRTFDIVGIGGIPTDGGEQLASGPRLVLLEQATAQELLNKVDQFDYIAATATDGTSEIQLTDTLSQILPTDQETLTGEQFIAESEESISKIISLFAQPILAFGYISAFVGAFVIYNTFSIVVAQRTRELALMRAVGAGRGQILGSVMVEAALVGLVASGLGVVLGWVLAYVLKFALSSSFVLPDGIPSLTVSAVVWALAIGLGSTIVSALIPGVRATTIPPIAALGNVAIDRSALSRFRRVAGPVLLIAGLALIVLVSQEVWALGLAGIGVGAGLLFLALATLGPLFAGPLTRGIGVGLPRLRGIAGRIGKENASRNPKRTTITAVALSIGVSLVTIVAIFAASLSGAVKAQIGDQLADVDFIVDSGTGFAGLSPDAGEYLKTRPEVAAVNVLRYNIATMLNSTGAEEERADKGDTLNGNPVGESEFIIGVDPTAAFEMLRFDLTPAITDLADDEVMVLAKTAQENGWTAGDEVEVWFATTGAQTWTIAATFDTRVGTGAEYITNLATVTANAAPEFQVDATIYVKLKDGVDAEEAKAAIKPELKKIAPTAGLNTVSDYLEERLAILNSVVNLIYVLLALSIVVALVGVGNTISLSIHERTRELGLLRAVGMARRQLGESVGWESVIIALAGTVIGLAVGVALALVFVDAVDEESLVAIVSIPTVVIIGVLGALAGVLTAVRPALRATRVDILAAISSV